MEYEKQKKRFFFFFLFFMWFGFTAIEFYWELSFVIDF